MNNYQFYLKRKELLFYEGPDFDENQRFTYFTLTKKELQIALKRQNLSAKVHCILQIGYFKAVKLFFKTPWDEPIQMIFNLFCSNIFASNLSTQKNLLLMNIMLNAIPLQIFLGIGCGTKIIRPYSMNVREYYSSRHTTTVCCTGFVILFNRSKNRPS
ncbi:MAG: DUF4158 domain-containing protein [Legionella sp.]|nr:DUF4158 domain-containing protein [Legionella sp.]